MFGKLGQLGQIASLLGNPEKLKKDMEAMNQRLAAARFVGEAGGGMGSNRAAALGAGSPRSAARRAVAATTRSRAGCSRNCWSTRKPNIWRRVR